MLSRSLASFFLLLSAVTTSAKPMRQLVGLSSFRTRRAPLDEVADQSLLGHPSPRSIPSSTASKTLAVPSSTPSRRREKKLASRHFLTGLLPGVLNATPVINADVQICLDLSLSVLGIRLLDTQAVAGLSGAISSRGISVQQLAVVQAYVANKLRAAAVTATDAGACRAACDSNICPSFAFDSVSRTCTLTPRTLEPTSGILATLIGELSLQGPNSSEYCKLCPDRCTTSPSARSRMAKRNPVPMGLCPLGLNACPISPFSTSKGYECIDTQEEIESCGGCSSTGQGINCNTIPGVKLAGCAMGQCLALKCDKGFELSSENKCLAIKR